LAIRGRQLRRRPTRLRPCRHHHVRAVSRLIEEDRLEVAALIEAEPIEHVAGEQHEARALGAEGDGLALEVLDGAGGAVGADDEHARCRVHGGQDAQVRRRAADAVERLQRRLALHERDIEPAVFQHRHVFGAALGVLRPHLEVGRLVDGGATACQTGKPPPGVAVPSETTVFHRPAYSRQRVQ
jgi:hypothetical protein